MQARLVYQVLKQLAAAHALNLMELRARTTMSATLVHAILLQKAALKLLEGSHVTQITYHALVLVLVKTLEVVLAITVFA